MTNPFKNFTIKDWLLLVLSLAAVTVSNMLSGDADVLTLFTTCVGVTSLVLAAKGHPLAMALMVVFGILYAVISAGCRYWSEVITYLGMSVPMSFWSFITWLKHPSENGNEVAVRKIGIRQWGILSAFCVPVTVFFYFIMKMLDTPNLFVSTLSIITSFMAAGLTILRSPYYALFYAMNDVVLMVLWSIAALQEPGYIPVVINFSIFLINDIYGFISWKRREHGSTKG